VNKYEKNTTAVDIAKMLKAQQTTVRITIIIDWIIFDFEVGGD